MKNKILICGASKNLGKYLSESLNKKYKIIKISSTLKPDNKKIFYSDFKREETLNSTLIKIKKKVGKPDAIIFTVGKSSPTKGNLTDYKNSFDINFFSFVNLINSCEEVFKKNIKIVVISSIAGVKHIEAPIEYSVSKSALIYYAKIISKDLIKKGIYINIISPGNILIKGNNWSKKLSNNKNKVKKYIKKNVPSNDFIKPEEISRLCELILSKKNFNLVGSNIIIDGGQSI